MFTKADIEKYFIAEKQESLLFLGLGLAAMAIALTCYLICKTPFWKGAAIPLIVIGIIQVTVGYTVYRRSDADRVRNVYNYDMNPGDFRNRELPRMQQVKRNFAIYRWAEILLSATGLILFFYFRGKPGADIWHGLGLTLAIQAILMLGADYFAEQRAKKYTAGIEQFIRAKS